MAVVHPAELAAVSELHRSRSDAAVTRPHPTQPAEPPTPESAATQHAMSRVMHGDAEPDVHDAEPDVHESGHESEHESGHESEHESEHDSGHDDDTRPALELPLPAPASSNPAIDLGELTGPRARGDQRVDHVPSRDGQTAWARGLAARIGQSAADDTPARPPTRGELQASSDVAPDATRQQSIEEIERLQRSPVARRSSEELEFTRRAPYPTAEVSEEDIEAAIEIAPSARRAGAIPIGIAKKKPPTG